ncbi:DUF2124 family protein [Methanogenium sp. MK-MG]|uniref:DUF2124 family protein n=1 Tax=Methanogenium sp. MK-MG TaxID=2599926 RepID=UPI0020B11405|nr:DUF2124 family protein [Methanogenium sp. MK-MG]KAF1075749.1 hypothetical protein MKMG_01663 [Methanogenium sp. MK-MG]
MRSKIFLIRTQERSMELQESGSGLAGMLRPFKKFMVESGIMDTDQVVFYGCPGTCTPFIELLTYAARDLPFEYIFVPRLDESSAKVLKPVPHVGMQVTSHAPETFDPKVIIIMGGLAMPNEPVTAEMVHETIAGYDAKIVGICFMDMFRRAGWLEKIAFEMVINAQMNPVEVWK